MSAKKFYFKTIIFIKPVAWLNVALQYLALSQLIWADHKFAPPPNFTGRFEPPPNKSYMYFGGGGTFMVSRNQLAQSWNTKDKRSYGERFKT